MSAQQSNYACLLTVEPFVAGVLREEAKKVLEFNHEHFEDLRELSPDAQHALSLRFTDAIAVINAVGWAATPHAGGDATEPVEVPLTDGFIEQLHHRRYDLGFTNLDRLGDLDDTNNEREAAKIRAEITADRLAAQALDGLFTTYTNATKH
jgi:hypothetical protein